MELCITEHRGAGIARQLLLAVNILPRGELRRYANRVGKQWQNLTDQREDSIWLFLYKLDLKKGHWHFFHVYCIAILLCISCSMCVCVCVYVYIYIYIHICMYIYIYLYTYLGSYLYVFFFTIRSELDMLDCFLFLRVGLINIWSPAIIETLHSLKAFNTWSLSILEAVQ